MLSGAGRTINQSPSPIVTVHTFQIACINRPLLPCVLLAGEIEGEPGFIARVGDRTNGQLQFELTSLRQSARN